MAYQPTNQFMPIQQQGLLNTNVSNGVQNNAGFLSNGLGEAERLLAATIERQNTLQNALYQCQQSQASNNNLMTQIDQNKNGLGLNVTNLQNELAIAKKRLVESTMEKQKLNQYLHQRDRGHGAGTQKYQLIVNQLNGQLQQKNQQFQMVQMQWSALEKEKYDLQQKVASYSLHMSENEKHVGTLKTKIQELESQIMAMSNTQSLKDSQIKIREQVIQQNITEVIWRTLSKMYAGGSSKNQVREYANSMLKEQSSRAATLSVQNKSNSALNSADPMFTQTTDQANLIQQMHKFYTGQYSFDDDFMDNAMRVDRNKTHVDQIYFAHAMLHLRKNRNKNISYFLSMNDGESHVIKLLVKDFVPDMTFIQT